MQLVRSTCPNKRFYYPQVTADCHVPAVQEQTAQHINGTSAQITPNK